jgi:hypothetical protein
MKKERGFIYPVVIIICFITLLFFSYLTEKVFSQRQFAILEEERLKEVRLIQQGMGKTEKLLAEEQQSVPFECDFTWNGDRVHVTVNQLTPEEVIIQITASTGQMHSKDVQVVYNIDKSKVIKWVEG